MKARESGGARKEAQARGLKAEFIRDDIRNLRFDNEFDAVLNLADGAIGYLENDGENLKIFDVVSKALRPNGGHFMDICNAEHAELHFPKRHWEIGSRSLSLPDFAWDGAARRMLYSQWEAEFGKVLERPEDSAPVSTTRLYSKGELARILEDRRMRIVDTFGDYTGKKDSPAELQLLVYSRKTG